jgi:phosphate-selective porin OprO/OprP
MKNLYNKILPVFLILLLFSVTLKAQQSDELINLLIQKNVITQKEADSLRADLAIKAQDQRDKQTKFSLNIGRALTLGGLLQARYQAFQGTSGNNGFDVRRARLSLKGGIANNWDYELYFELAGAPILLDGIVGYKFGDYLKLSAGQLKIPFSLESITSDSQLELIDRSQIEEVLAARGKDVIGNQIGRDIGAFAAGSFFRYKDAYLFDYQLGVYNGNGINKTADNNKKKDLGGRLTVHPISNLSISYDFYRGHAIYGTVTATQTRNRHGVDARYIHGPLSLTAEYDKGIDGLIHREGWYAQAAYYVLPKKLQIAVKYDKYNPTQTNNLDESRWYIGAVNYYFNSWAKFAIDYTYKREQAPAQTLNNLLAVQMQLTF